VGELSQFIINVFLCFSFMFFVLIRQSGGTPMFQLYIGEYFFLHE
jgi:hypothetical protein